MKSRVFYEEFDSFYYYGGSSQDWNMQGFHFHKDFEIILFMSDGAKISIDNREYRADKGDLFVINNHELHKTMGVKGQEYSRYVLMFDPDSIKKMSVACDYQFTKYFEARPDGFIHKLCLNDKHLQEVIARFHQIEICSGQQGHENKVKLNLAILELLISINQLYDFFSVGKEISENEEDTTQQKRLAPDRERIELIKKYITAHIEDKLDLDYIADQFYLNKYYLSHYFKKETGFTISQYITNQKMMEAKKRLKQGFSVLEVAVALSYYSDSHFINTFKKNIGTTPKQYALEQIKK